MSFTQHVHFEFLRAYFHIDWTSDERSRFRIDLRKLPRGLLPFVRGITAPCVACGAEIHPLRQNGTARHPHIYFAATCPLSVNIACSRQPEAREEYQAVRRAVEAYRALMPWERKVLRVVTFQETFGNVLRQAA